MVDKAIVYTKIDRGLYNEIKNKGYKFAELIKLGYKVKEMEGEYGRLLISIVDRLESLAKIHEQLIKEQQNALSNINAITLRQELFASSLKAAIDNTNNLIKEQREFMKTADSLLNNMLSKTNQMLEDRILELEDKVNDLVKKLNLAFMVISHILPKDKAEEIVRAIVKRDEKRLSEILLI